MSKMMIVLREDESAALRALAARDRRYPRDQAVLIIRRELERAGLLPSDLPTPATPIPQAVTNVR